MGKRFPASDLGQGRVAVVGVGGGADGALRLAELERRFGFAVAISPKTGTARARRTAKVIELDPPAGRRHWVAWRADLPAALRGLATAGFGQQSA